MVVRTTEHPASVALGQRRSDLISCDDIYQTGPDFDQVYRLIVERVLGFVGTGKSVVYAVPGSPWVGERSVSLLLAEVNLADLEVDLIAAPSFLDLLLARAFIDPLRDGLTVLDAHRLPNPMLLSHPTVISGIDHPVVMSDTLALLGRVTGEDTEIALATDLGGKEEEVIWLSPGQIPTELTGPRTSLLVKPQPGGLVGAVRIMQRLRDECPWDRVQTHHSLVGHLLEESAELADAIASLPASDHPEFTTRYAQVEEELGDVLLQIIFHSNIAAETGSFDLEDVGQQLTEKLTRRHPHVFGHTRADTPEQVTANWAKLKELEKTGDTVEGVASKMDGIPRHLPAITRAFKVQRRAASVGFDWSEPEQVIDKLAEEMEELLQARGDPEQRRQEIGDLMFTVINLARHLEVEPEGALRASITRFESRFRSMESQGSLDNLSLQEMEERWQQAKQAE